MYKLDCFDTHYDNLVFSKTFDNIEDLESELKRNLEDDLADSRNNCHYKAFEKRGWTPINVSVSVQVTI